MRENKKESNRRGNKREKQKEKIKTRETEGENKVKKSTGRDEQERESERAGSGRLTWMLRSRMASSSTTHSTKSRRQPRRSTTRSWSWRRAARVACVPSSTCAHTTTRPVTSAGEMLVPRRAVPARNYKRKTLLLEVYRWTHPRRQRTHRDGAGGAQPLDGVGQGQRRAPVADLERGAVVGAEEVVVVVALHELAPSLTVKASASSPFHARKRARRCASVVLERAGSPTVATRSGAVAASAPPLPAAMPRCCSLFTPAHTDKESHKTNGHKQRIPSTLNLNEDDVRRSLESGCKSHRNTARNATPVTLNSREPVEVQSNVSRARAAQTDQALDQTSSSEQDLHLPRERVSSRRLSESAESWRNLNRRAPMAPVAKSYEGRVVGDQGGRDVLTRRDPAGGGSRGGLPRGDSGLGAGSERISWQGSGQGLAVERSGKPKGKVKLEPADRGETGTRILRRHVLGPTPIPCATEAGKREVLQCCGS
ncbi:LOW QUALITY PROTEIN: Protein of unknown function [Gryllus bimaculatus]|nr:LOW QUALITY PROTEIN: Protein of unknown function [Gryllus bimaculatus]